MNQFVQAWFNSFRLGFNSFRLDLIHSAFEDSSCVEELWGGYISLTIISLHPYTDKYAFRQLHNACLYVRHVSMVWMLYCMYVMCLNCMYVMNMICNCMKACMDFQSCEQNSADPQRRAGTLNQKKWFPPLALTQTNPLTMKKSDFATQIWWKEVLPSKDNPTWPEASIPKDQVFLHRASSPWVSNPRRGRREGTPSGNNTPIQYSKYDRQKTTVVFATLRNNCDRVRTFSAHVHHALSQIQTVANPDVWLILRPKVVLGACMLRNAWFCHSEDSCWLRKNYQTQFRIASRPQKASNCVRRR